MKKSLENYFEKQYRKLVPSTDNNIGEYVQQARREPIADVLENAISNFTAETIRPLNLRADAKVFLYRNFEELVFNPLNRNPSLRRQLLENIQSDMTQILLEAENIARKNGKTEISSHQVLLAVSKKWNVLKTLSKDSW